MNKKTIVLDATLRDGGLVNRHQFSENFVKKLYEMNVMAQIDYMEFGYRASKDLFHPGEYGKWKFCSDDDIRGIVGENDTHLKVSIMADAGRCDYKEDIHPKADSPVDLIRVSTYLYQIPEAIKMIEDTYKKGYEITCNIMAISECDFKQLRVALTELAKMPVSAVYIVDSFGALYPGDIRKYVNCYLEILNSTGKQIGIHAHNNQQCAFANTIEGMEVGATWLDATVYGMGRGAGNCHLEALIGYLKNDQYKIDPILEFIQNEMIALKKSGVVWGYNTYYLLTGIANKHPKTAILATKEKNKKFVNFRKNLE